MVRWALVQASQGRSAPTGPRRSQPSVPRRSCISAGGANVVSSARGRRKIPAALFGPRFGARVWQITTPITAWSSFLSLHHGQGKGIESILTSIVLCLLGIGMLLAGPATMTDTIIGLWYTFSTVIMTEIPAPEETAPSNRPAPSPEHAKNRAGHQP